MKRILTLILVLMLCINLCPVYARTISNDDTLDLAFLNKIGIVQGDENGLRAKDNITRMEFVALLIRFLGYEDVALSYDSSAGYSDVSADSWGKKYIDFATDLGCVQGYGENRFEPDNDVTCNEVIKTVICALGYGDIAARDGYPNGYISMARRLDIMRTVSIGDGASDRANVAALLVNSLDVHMRSRTSESDGDMYVIDDKPMIEILGYEIFEGTVMSTYGADLGNGSKLDRDEVMIGERIFTSLCGSMTGELGYRLKFYAKKNPSGRYEIYYAERIGSDDETVIYADQIDDSTTVNAIVYYDESDKKRTINLDSSTVIVYNGKILASADITSSALKPKSGYIVVNDSSDADIRSVFVWEYSNYIVKSVYSDVVYAKYGKSINLDKDDANAVEIIYNGETVDTDAIKNGMVLSVAKSLDGRYIRAYLTDNTVSGTVASMDEDSVELSVGDNAAVYKMTTDFRKEYNKTKSDIVQFNPGDDVSLSIDYFGQIADAESAGLKGDYKYGYLLDISLGSGLDDSFALRLIDDNNNICDIEADRGSKIFFGRANGGGYVISQKSASDVADAVSDSDGVKKQLIKYRLNNSGSLKGIYLTSDAESAVWGETSKMRSREYYNKVINNEYLIDANTVLFNIPNGGKKIEECKSGKAMTMISNATYSMALYDIEDKCVGAVVMTPSVTEGTGYKYIIDKVNSPVMLIEKVVTAMNEDEMPETKLTGWQNGKEISVFVSGSLQNNSDSRSFLKPGVVIQYLLNDDERKNAYTKDNAQHIILFKKLIDFNEYNDPAQYWNYTSVADSNAGIRTIYGIVSSYDGTNLVLEADGLAAATVHGGTSAVRWTRGVNKGEEATLDSIGVGQQVFVRTRYNSTRDVFIID